MGRGEVFEGGVGALGAEEELEGMGGKGEEVGVDEAGVVEVEGLVVVFFSEGYGDHGVWVGWGNFGKGHFWCLVSVRARKSSASPTCK